MENGIDLKGSPEKLCIMNDCLEVVKLTAAGLTSRLSHMYKDYGFVTVMKEKLLSYLSFRWYHLNIVPVMLRGIVT